MAQAARAYRQVAYPEYVEERSFAPSDVRAVRTAGHNVPSASQAPSLLATIGKMAAIVIVVVAALSFARIALTNAAVTTLIESDALSAQIADARSSGVGLEMQQSVLSSPTAINSAVKRLGMTAPGELETIELAPDVVAYDASGELSLSGSVKNVVEFQR